MVLYDIILNILRDSSWDNISPSIDPWKLETNYLLPKCNNATGLGIDILVLKGRICED